MYFIKSSNKIQIQLESLLIDVKRQGDNEKAEETFSKVFPVGTAGTPSLCFLSLAIQARPWGQREIHPSLTCFYPQSPKERSERCVLFFLHKFG